MCVSRVLRLWLQMSSERSEVALVMVKFRPSPHYNIGLIMLGSPVFVLTPKLRSRLPPANCSAACLLDENPSTIPWTKRLRAEPAEI